MDIIKRFIFRIVAAIVTLYIISLIDIEFYSSIFISIGVLFLLNCLFCFFNEKRNSKSFKIVYGVLIEYREENDREYVSYYPVIEYEDPISNEKSIYKPSIGVGWRKYNIGQKVKLRCYYNGEILKVNINTWFYNWNKTFGNALFGFIFIVIGLFS